mmetsp:Transcript_5176/g.7206  ORF Transcript_5176/g.7206 Transcript_5176/m.7206 type:complete len:205 (-) Transcript_5176:997-1611(-)
MNFTSPTASRPWPVMRAMPMIFPSREVSSACQASRRGSGYAGACTVGHLPPSGTLRRVSVTLQVTRSPSATCSSSSTNTSTAVSRSGKILHTARHSSRCSGDSLASPGFSASFLARKAGRFFSATLPLAAMMALTPSGPRCGSCAKGESRWNRPWVRYCENSSTRTAAPIHWCEAARSSSASISSGDRASIRPVSSRSAAGTST